MTKAKPLPSLEMVSELFGYDVETGFICWKAARGKKIKAGQPAGTISKKGYLKIAITIDKKYCVFQAHRLIWYITTGVDPMDKQIDHIDGNPLNNKISNLRLATNAENQRNKPANQNNSSGFKGVSYKKSHKRWCASIGFNGKKFCLGFFDTPELAHMAYCKAAAELHGDFARGA